MNLFKSSWRIGSLAGIGVYMHWTFLLLVAWVLFSQLLAGQGISAAMLALVLLLALFGCVVLHELGHALTARRFGVKTQDITLLPIGGVAQLERIPEDPRQELAIAVAGPLVNVAIAGCLAIVLGLFGGILPLSRLTLAGGSLLSALLWINLTLAVFNMMPAFPMDGGRVLRALLAFRKPYGQATQIASKVGQALAISFGIIGLFGGNLILVLIALFILVAGQQEASLAQMKDMTRGLPVVEAMSFDFHMLHPYDSIEDAAQLLMHGYRGDFPIVTDGKVVGMLLHRDVLKAVVNHDVDLFVEDLMHKDFPTIAENEPLTNAIEMMSREGCHSVAVMRSDRVVGMLDLLHLGEWVTMHAALLQSSNSSSASREQQRSQPTPVVSSNQNSPDQLVPR
jgi:Zn-dependent protease